MKNSGAVAFFSIRGCFYSNKKSARTNTVAAILRLKIKKLKKKKKKKPYLNFEL